MGIMSRVGQGAPQWFVEWEYFNTITNTGPFPSLDAALDFIVKDTPLMSQNGYGQQLQAISINERRW